MVTPSSNQDHLIAYCLQTASADLYLALFITRTPYLPWTTKVGTTLPVRFMPAVADMICTAIKVLILRVNRTDVVCRRDLCTTSHRSFPRLCLLGVKGLEGHGVISRCL